ncbi:MAG TPA: adenylate/guanylate cyclase domain-containing protein, partial [Spirochaetota bacterium]|nr:adenylate/guanylate cyclase domain-containing protein [Spirochaetota bacterium]
EGTTLLVYKTPGDNRAASVSGESGSPLLIEQPGNINTFLPYLQGLVVKKYIFEDDPYSGRYYLFANFFNQVDNGVMGTVPDTINGYIKLYPRWLAMNGYPQKDFMMLNGKQILSVLQEPWGNGFLKYYNHFLFAGAFATGIGDIKQTPYGEMAGINVIINAFSTIVTENQLKKSGEVSLLNLGFMKVKLDILLLVLVGLLFGFLYGLTNIRINTYIFLGFLVATFLISLSLFLYNNFYLNIFPLVLINIFVFGSTIIYKLMTEEKDKKFIKATFANYLSQELIDNMIQNKQMPTLGGESRDMTPYFTDIQGFSTFSEKLTADQLVELLNEYLSAMTDILMAENGTLDKYEGDAIIAFFGAPVYSQRHPLEACYVGLNMQQKLLELREKWRNEKALPEEGERNKTKVPAEQWAPGAKWPKIVHDMKMRIGINTGEIVVGNMGSELRKNYTMMGDAVNLAARLEAGAKQYGVYTLVSEYTLNQEIKKEDGSVKKVIDFLEVRFIDKLTVVGRSEPLKVYELCARKGELSEQEKTLFKLFNEGMAFYKNMEWDKAIARFSESVKIERVPDGKTTPSEVFRKRCEQYKKEPPEGPEPGTPWDGVCRLTSK